GFDSQRNASEQTGAAYGNNYRFKVGNLLNDLEAHRSLSGNNRGIIVAVDIRKPFLRCDLVCVCSGFAEIRTVQDNSRTELLARAHLYEGRESGHYYCCGYAEYSALIGECLSMVARRSSNDSALLLVTRQLCQRIARASFLE